MKNQESKTLVEFTQSYRDGIKITKRGLSASPMICQKYGLKPGKVAVFTSPMGGRKAMSVFHFHPSCSLKNAVIICANTVMVRVKSLGN